MAAKRVLILSVLLALSALTGCRTYCDRHYPCQAQQPAYQAPACYCVCPPAGQVPPAPPAQANYQSSGCYCQPVQPVQLSRGS